MMGGRELIGGKELTLGNGEIHIAAERSTVYVAPTMIVHYIIDHYYLPPATFIEAGPPARSRPRAPTRGLRLLGIACPRISMERPAPPASAYAWIIHLSVNGADIRMEGASRVQYRPPRIRPPGDGRVEGFDRCGGVVARS